MVRTRREDSDEQRVIDDIEQYGWHIVRVEAGKGPAVAYSAGMFHGLEHPEILLFRLNSAERTAQIISNIGDSV